MSSQLYFSLPSFSSSCVVAGLLAYTMAGIDSDFARLAVTDADRGSAQKTSVADLDRDFLAQ
jgi:hypothetical protein